VSELKIFALVPVGFALLGALALWFSIHQRRAVQGFKARAARASGVCTSVRSQVMGTVGDPTVLYFPVVRFTLPDGREVEAETAVGTSPPAAQAGQHVTVLYDPDRPTSIRLEGFRADGTLVHAVFGVIGGVFLVFGLLGTVIAVWALTR